RKTSRTWVRTTLGMSLVCCVAADAAAQIVVPGGGLGSIYQDAEQGSLNTKTQDQEFSGDVVLIGAGTLLAADKVTVAYETQRVNASGHIVVMTKEQVFTGTEVEYDIRSGDF